MIRTALTILLLGPLTEAWHEAKMWLPVLTTWLRGGLH